MWLNFNGTLCRPTQNQIEELTRSNALYAADGLQNHSTLSVRIAINHVLLTWPQRNLH